MPGITVEIAFALPDTQFLRSVMVEKGASVADVIAASGVQEAFAGQGLQDLPVGIWGRKVTGCEVVKDGDRVEIYRLLEMDPREARRRLALAGRTMRGAAAD